MIFNSIIIIIMFTTSLWALWDHLFPFHPATGLTLLSFSLYTQH
jgi:hypothetical protein